MSADFKDSPEIIEFRKLFARLKNWSEDDPVGVAELAREDEGIQELCLSILKAAGSIQRSEQSTRDLFTGPVDPKFISEWRDFEERFAGIVLSIRSDIAAAGRGDLIFSFDYYEESDQWEIADFKAVTAAQSFDAIIWFAQGHAKKLLEDRPSLNWQELNPKAFSDDFKGHYLELARAAIEAEDEYEAMRNQFLNEIGMSHDESQRATLLDFLAKIREERWSQEEMPIEHVAEDAWAEWKG